MAIQTTKIPKHWNYFLCIEDDLLNLSRWIEFAAENFACFSVELARLLMTCSSETDVVAKALCARIDASAGAASINKYQDLLVKHYRHLPLNTIQAPRFGLTLTPWENWSKPSNPPDWWTANNKVKHHRGDHFHFASLHNTLNAAAGLFTLLILYYGAREQRLTPLPRLFESERYAYRDGDMLMLRQQ
jgi:hypothetical protein